MIWHTVELTEVCELITDGTHYTPKNIGFGVPFLTVKNIDSDDNKLDFLNCSFISKMDFQQAAQGNSAPVFGDVLFSKDGTVGKVHVVKTRNEFAVLSSIAILRPNKNIADPIYLGFALKSPVILNDALSRKTGSAIRRIVLSDLKKVKIPLPPLAEQKRIAAILDKADAIKRKREQAIAKLDKLAQSIFVEMFGNIANNDKGWECALLANVCERAGEYGAGVASIPYSNSLPIYVRITDIDDNGDLTKKPVSPAGNQKDWCNYKLEVGDVLFARSGATVGKTYLHKNTEGYYVFAGYLIRFRPIVSLVNPQFLFHFTKTDFYNAWVIARQRVVAQPNINAKQYGYDLLIPVPPIALQEQFATRISKLEKLKASNIAALEKHNQLFASLQSQAFTGQL